MAEALLGVVTEAVFSKALSLATAEISGVLGVWEDLGSLAEQLEMIQALLSDAEPKSSTNGLVQLWLKKLEAAATDADNLLDEFAYQVLHLKMQKGMMDKGMSSLEEWSDASSVSSDKLFPHLEKLEIEGCVNLTHLPGFLGNISSLRQLTFQYFPSLIQLTESLSDLEGLKSLKISKCHKLVSIPDLSSCRSLNELVIFKCPKLSALPRGIEACRSLQTLRIPCPASLMRSLPHYFTNLTSLDLDLSNNIDFIPLEPVSNIEEYDIQRHNPFATLEHLCLKGMPELKSLPEHIQHFSALTDLRLEDFDGLEALPEWLGNFHSLRSLYLTNCMSLMSFPSVEVMQGLTNLKSMDIIGCPILRQRCKRGSGAEWHKIAHVSIFG